MTWPEAAVLIVVSALLTGYLAFVVWRVTK